MKEIEAKILEIDEVSLLATLQRLEAVKEFSLPFHAVYFDLPGHPLTNRGESLRLRREGDDVVLTFKQLVADAPTGVKMREEKEVQVSDFATMRDILTGLGYLITLEMPKTRVQFRLDACHVVIDRYEGPFSHVPPFMEIEAPTLQELHEATLKLGFSLSDLCDWSTHEVLQHYRREG